METVLTAEHAEPAETPSHLKFGELGEFGG
jgi:hypothetical protein